jgi:hypothetical protein
MRILKKFKHHLIHRVHLRLVSTKESFFGFDFSDSFINKAKWREGDDRISDHQKDSKFILRDLFKEIHPDLFTMAPAHIQEANSLGLQELNSYIKSVEENTGVNHTKLEFYIKSKGGDFKDHQKKGKRDREEEEQKMDREKKYIKINIELLPLRANSSQDLQQIHMQK